MYIIDSEQIASPLAYGINFATSTPVLSSEATTANVGKMNVYSIIFIAQDTSAQVKFAIGDTNNIVIDYLLMNPDTAGSYIQQRNYVHELGEPVSWNGVFIPVITACTAVLVLG
jgi:hypothetical protein